MLEFSSLVTVPQVLIVDDDDDTRARFVRALAREGISTIEAGDGECALEIIRNQPIAVVLLDGGLPGLSGIDVVEQLRNDPQLAMLPVVMVTATAELAARVAGLEAGADDYVSKPVNMAELIARIQAQLRRHEAWLHAERSLQRWASVIDALARLDRSQSAEETADRVCELLADEFDAVAIIAFTENGAGVLSACGALARGTNSELDPNTTRRLRGLCLQGPWSGSAGGLAAIGPIVRLAYGVPLAADGRLLGAVLFGSSPLPIDIDDTLLPTAVGIGAVITSLLVPGLELRDAQARHRDERAEIFRAGAFQTHFQPVVELGTGRAVGFEALTRWADGVAPDVRLEAARIAGYANELERAMITNALQEAVDLPTGCWVSVNASAVLVRDDADLSELLAGAEREVVLELTEQEPVDDYPGLRGALAELGEDVLLAIDDAGAGYASLRHILALEPTFVKLDRDWIRGIDADKARQALVVGLQHFAEETGRWLVAEGIETAAELETVMRLGIRYGQGFFLGRPASLTGTPTGGPRP